MQQPEDHKVTWEAEVAEHIKSILLKDSRQNNSGPLMVGIVGIPGSGKTTSARILSDMLKNLQIPNMIMPMDGYHYPLSTLNSFENANDLVYRRGAPDTFDSQRLMNDLSQIKKGLETFVPDFDHAVGDPIPNAFKFESQKSLVVICEGLYLLHEDDGWNGIGDLLEFTVFIDANVDICVQRLKTRNLCIPGYTKDEIEVRCDAVDRVNAMTVLSSRGRANLIVHSVAL
mmetsp:Transcript_16229/g.24259  ORF Transcript_16229/g.24259 Transcript_16229/m.24259 type:complete len:229 (+) Transcript_16229:173-859(+)